ncbi:GGDEF domain-containing protein [Aliivibrio sp. S3MY1]|uniref:GGDEF domain-containing protein n=1 Tax=unclassified Aliivibrio TaxID=2645654 RepID=UPI0023794CD8|nr:MULTISPECIES: GGDEF domain-containing protein [unclassified Aliivibrio]MDD9194259.1 GGDEF domain-containing protein [Aliivibrio sp. S3MY1]MDD9197926.1 GGDEF domain-containing protein [Aliivibrio sp. S2MY1]
MKRNFIVRILAVNFVFFTLVLSYHHIKANTLKYRIVNKYESMISITRNFHHRYLNTEYALRNVGLFAYQNEKDNKHLDYYGGAMFNKDGLYPILSKDLYVIYNKLSERLPEKYINSLEVYMPSAHYILPFSALKNNELTEHKLSHQFTNHGFLDSDCLAFRENEITIFTSFHNNEIASNKIVLPICINLKIEAAFVIDIDGKYFNQYIEEFNEQNFTQYEIGKNNGFIRHKIDIPYSNEESENVYFGIKLINVIFISFILTLIAELVYLISCHLYNVFYKSAFYDSMTGCLRRNIFEMKYKSIRNYGVILLDIDHFKSINDNYGHAIGDRIISSVGKVIIEQAHKNVLNFRWGGEEFLILLPNTSKDALQKYAEKLRENIESSPLLDQKIVTVSLGLTEQKHQENIHLSIHRADIGLYKAKSLGRNQSYYI